MDQERDHPGDPMDKDLYDLPADRLLTFGGKTLDHRKPVGVRQRPKEQWQIRRDAAIGGFAHINNTLINPLVKQQSDRRLRAEASLDSR